jgi:hypothetical protein
LSTGIVAEALLNSATDEVKGPPVKRVAGDWVLWGVVCEGMDRVRMLKVHDKNTIARIKRVIRSLSLL